MEIYDTLRRTLLASGGAFLYSWVILACYWLDYVLMDVTRLVTLYTCFWSGHLAMLGFVYWRHKKHMSAPSLTLFHMTWGITFVSIVFYHTTEVRSVLMMAYLIILPLGAFRLKWRGFFGITLFTLASYAVVLFLLQQNRSSYWSPQIEAVIGATFLLAIMSYCISGREFGILRERLTNRNQQLNIALKKIKELAITDELTGLYNRRHLFDQLAKQRAIANREGTNLVLGFVNLDKFKSINDQFGLQVGDDVLRRFSGLLQESIREVDLVARYGGEEFVLLFKGVGLETATVAVERIRYAVESLEFSEQALAITISVGITEYRTPETAKDTLERANKLLSQAKQSGCNRVVQDCETGKL
jgi:diguanylate cyclase (GGDEF)-like protein